MPTGTLAFVTTYGSPSAILTGAFAPGQIARLTWNGVRKDVPGCGQYGYAVQVDANGGDTKPEARFPLSTTSGVFELAITQPSTVVEFNAFTDSLCSAGALLNASWDVTGTPGDCQYGTRKKAGAPNTSPAGQAALDALTTKYGVPWLVQYLLQFAFSTIDITDLCGRGPGAFPPIDQSTVQASITTWLSVYKYLLWLDNCECIPGAPAPTPPPPPNTVAPPGWPTAPVFPCSNTDLCALLVQIAQQLAALVQQETSANQLLTLLQRYSLPFAYIPGAVHSGLTNSGSFAISRLLGMKVEITQTPGQPAVWPGNPPYVKDLGWMSCLDGNGFIEEKRISHGLQIWTPRLMPDAITFGYFLEPGVVANFTELEAEP